MTAPLAVPAGAGPVIADEICRYGRRGTETGGFLLAPEGTGSVSIVAFAGAAGITRRRLLFQVSELALDRLFGFAAARRCWVPAQFHSHAAGAFLSVTDQEHGLRVSGFASAVVPEFADPPAAVAAWSWWRFDDGEWVGAPAPRTADGDLEAVIFDEDGVRGA
jgi:hypothetical protein